MTGSRRPLVSFALVAALGVLVHTPPAAAQSTGVMAEALFQEGKRLMADGNYAEACPKLAESQRLDPGAGALTALALCHKAQGKTASAWSEFKEVLSLARRDGRKDREQVAQDGIVELEPKLSRLLLDVTREAIAQGVEVRLDDTVVSRAVFGQPIPVDPGTHHLEARAPGKHPFSTTVDIAEAHDDKSVLVEALAPEPGGEEAAPVRERGVNYPLDVPHERDPGAVRRTAGYALAGLGVVGIAVGGVFGLHAIARESDSDALCGSTCNDPDGLQANADARRAAARANVVLGAGLVALAAGVVLVLTAPGPPPQRAARPAPRRDAWRTVLSGAF
jgi:hypothetical protein